MPEYIILLTRNRVKSKLPKVLPAKLPRNKTKLRKELYATVRTQCNECASTTQLDIHHKNGNKSDDTLDNLICLCRTCNIKYHPQMKYLKCPS